MLNLGRNDRWVDLKESNKPEAKPASTNAAAKPATASRARVRSRIDCIGCARSHARPG